MRSSQVISVLKGGSVLMEYPFKVHFRQGDGQIAISVPKRNFKRAVWRNLVRRRIREAYRLQVKEYPAAGRFDLLIVYVAKQIEDYKVIELNVAAILEKIGGMASDKAD